MSTRDNHRLTRNLIRAMLGTDVLTQEYDDYDTVAARERIAAALHASSPAEPDTGAATPPPARHAQAARDLTLASSLVLNMDQAADALARLGGTRREDAAGALVFGCLLYLADDQDGARWWWQVAARRGNRTAANCLTLHHSSHGRTEDADHWREQSAALRDAPAPTTSPGTHDRPLPEDRIRHGLNAACGRGSDPRLPEDVDAVIRRLSLDADDEELGAMARPTADLPTELANVRTPRPRG